MMRLPSLRQLIASGLLASMLASFAVPAVACSAFALHDKGAVLTVKSFDWVHTDHGMFVVNKRNVEKKSITLKETDVQAKWKSAYGSVTFNQHGRELPLGGMNTAGLVVEILWLDGSQFEAPDARPSANELQWIQYQLDNHASTEDVVRSLAPQSDDSISTPRLRISKVFANVHYFVCDVTRDCAVIEFLNGKASVSRGKTLPAKGITNSTYAESVAALGVANVNAERPEGEASSARFVRGARLAAAFKAGDSSANVQQSDALLTSVEATSTVLAAIWNQSHRTLTFRSKKERAWKTLDFNSLDFSCFEADVERPVKPSILDLAQKRGGDVGHRLVPYSREIQKRNVELGFVVVPEFLRKGLVRRATEFPDSSTTCLDKAAR